MEKRGAAENKKMRKKERTREKNNGYFYLDFNGRTCKECPKPGKKKSSESGEVYRIYIYESRILLKRELRPKERRSRGAMLPS